MQEHDLHYYCETSAKNGEMVLNLFRDMGKFIYKRNQDQLDNEGS